MSNISAGDATRIGAKSGLLGFLFMFLLMEAVALYQNTRGDFANGILFFFQAQTSKLFWGVVLVAGWMSFFLGRSAGRRILVDGRFPIGVAMLRALYSLLAMLAFIWVYSQISGRYIDQWAALVAVLALASGSIWLIAILNIRRSGR